MKLALETEYQSNVTSAGGISFYLLLGSPDMNEKILTEQDKQKLRHYIFLKV